MTEQTEHQSLSPGILSLLPLFYVGWSDSVLSPSEIKLIHKTLRSFPFLEEEDKDYLIRWTDPINPPPDEIFKFWIEEMKDKFVAMNRVKKLTLVDLGIEMAKAGSKPQNKSLWNNVETRLALKEIELALGVQSEYSSGLLLFKIEKEKKYSAAASSFEPEKMKAILDGEQISLRDKVRKLLCDPVFDNSYQIDKDLYRIKILNQLKMLANQGLGAFAFPEKYGGLNRRGEHITVFEMLSFGDLSLTVKFGVQFGLFGGAIFMLGTEKHHRKYIEALSKAELLGCYAMTETGHGSNVKNLETTAEYDHETAEFIIHSPTPDARKEYIGNALHGQLAVVFAQLKCNSKQHGVHAFLVPIRDETGNLMKGVQFMDNGYKMGLNGVDNGKLWFDHVRIPKDKLLDRYGTVDAKGQYKSLINNPSKRFFVMLSALVAGRISVSLASNSVAKTALAISIKYGLQRRQFSLKDNTEETLLLDYPSHQWRLLPLLAKTYAYDFALKELAEKYLNTDPVEMRKTESLAAGLKAKASWNCTRIVQTCREACGGMGYLKESGLPDLKADSDIFTTFEGDNTVLMQLVAKGLLTKFKHSFHEEGYRAVIQYLLTRFGNYIYELNPIQTRNTSVHHLSDREFHLHAFKYREQKLLFSLSQRMRNFLKKRIDPGQAYLKCQNHMIALAHAYIDRVVLKAFVRKISACRDENIKAILNRLCDLYALQIIYEERGWYLEADYMDGSKSKAIRRLLSKINQEIRPEAGALVESFGIPDQLLASKRRF